MKKNNTALIIGAVALYLLLRQRQAAPTTPYVPYQSYAPPAPSPSNAQAWSQWVNAIVNTYGTVSQLWQPGGPFYNQPVTATEAQQIANNFAFGFNQLP